MTEATESKSVTTHDVAIMLADTASEASLEVRLGSLPKEEFLRVWARSRPIAKFAAALDRIAKKRAVTELALGETWKDADSEIEWVWGKGQSDDWKVADPLGLRLGLAKLVRADGSRLFTDEECRRAVPDQPVPDHKVLTQFAARADNARELIDDFRKKPETAPALRERGV